MDLEMTWLGAAGWLLRHRGHTLAIDPFFHRPPAARPVSPIGRDDLPPLDHLLVTHAHYDHFADVPALAATHAAHTWAPPATLGALRRAHARTPPARRRPDREVHAVRDGYRFTVGDLEVSFHRIGTERFDVAMVRDSLRKLRGGGLADWVAAARFARTHLYGPCFAIVLHDRAARRKLAFLGNLTTDVRALAARHPDLDVAVLPYCPANRDWLAESVHVARALRPPVVLVHHFDQFLPPVTVGLDLPGYARGVEAGAPGTTVRIPKFHRPFGADTLFVDRAGRAASA